ncbi:alcohol dehydrogenase superfamily protein [Coprinopsis marcescibilis]|uniref:Alcohol dehydrogenase superfamily protein n=1 Tax=Coprinopsis marcescibilis TaxID=230819 RepID=A0A5C3L9K0_COPMA|nr:alcohol dehydrogenase superfamily protein [Coprinopsis marcescibilis]
MGLPQTSVQYVLPKVSTYKNLEQRKVQVHNPGFGQALVKIHAVSLQYRDLAIAAGSYDIGVYENIVPCSDMSGEIIAIGEGVTQWKVGDRVCSNFSTKHLHGDCTEESVQASLGGQSPGVLTQYRSFPVEALVSIPKHLSYVEASTLPCAALTAYAGLSGPVPVKAGDHVLVLGTGGVSIFALQFAVASGATVIATSSSDEKLKIAQKLGAKHLINYKKTPNWDEEVLKITGGRGVDHIIEISSSSNSSAIHLTKWSQVGGAGTLKKSIKSSRIGGFVHVIGFVSKDQPDMDLVVSVIMKTVTLRGVYIGSVSQFKDMNRLIEANPDKTRPVIDKVFSFGDALNAWAHLESQKHVGKIVIQVAKD